jgi:hypothetical protein
VGSPTKVPKQFSKQGVDMKRVGALIVFLVLFCAFANAQDLTDHWSSVDRCIAAKDAPFYYPKIVHQQKMLADEKILGLSSDSCVKMDLPDRIIGGGFVRIEAGRKMVYSTKTGAPIRLAECNNKVYEVVSLTPASTPPATPQKMDVQVSGIPEDINLGVNGEVKVIHSGAVDVNVHHSGTVFVEKISPKPESHGSRCGKWAWKCWVPPVAGGAAAGIYFATRGKKTPTGGVPPGGNTGPAF